MKTEGKCGANNNVEKVLRKELATEKYVNSLSKRAYLDSWAYKYAPYMYEVD